ARPSAGAPPTASPTRDRDSRATRAALRRAGRLRHSVRMTTTIQAARCFGDGDPLYEAYHDDEWGMPVHGEAALLERLALEAFQSGLAWITVLRKRPA